MDISNAALARILRAQAWERAKGELRSMLHTFHAIEAAQFDGKFDALDSEISKFISKIEDDCLHE
jgi:hypothetical protein